MNTEEAARQHRQEPNVDEHEVAKFAELADSWWDRRGPSKPLHDLNPCRLGFIQQNTDIKGLRVLDVGCGGGILSESLARAGAMVTGIDAYAELIEVAKAHAHEAQLPDLEYRAISLEEMLSESASTFDVVTCMELLEHVPDPAQLIDATSECLAPSGKVFFSTISRTPMAYLQAILGAEYVLRLLPRGTHDYQRFIKPSELSRWARAANLQLIELSGMSYNPLLGEAKLRRRVDVNFLACFGKG